MKIIPLILISVSILLSGCSGCSKSGQKHRLLNKSEPKESPQEEPALSGKANIVKLEIENGNEYIRIEINGIKLRFTFDTGADKICISPAEFIVLLKQGALLGSDVGEEISVQDATGRISTAKKINFREIKIGSKTLNDVEGLIMEDIRAPLLFGRSALDRFGKISIDNRKSEITFE